jgi:predicted nuclease of predicted toxin-antitoxin system
VSHKLLLDEDIHGDLAKALRARGIDAVRVQEIGTSGDDDSDQLALAVRLERAFVTFNRGDYTRLHRYYLESGTHHYGIMTCPQLPIGEVLRRLLRALDEHSDLRDRILYIR